MVVVGINVPHTLARTVLLGCAALVIITGLLVLFLRTDSAADRIGTIAGRVLRRDPRRIIVLLRRERRHLRHARSGPGSWRAVSVALARSIADYVCLLAAVAAVSPTPRPQFVLLAFVAAAVLRLLPFTPGGLGPVEAALIPLLAAASTRGPARCSPPSPTGGVVVAPVAALGARDVGLRRHDPAAEVARLTPDGAVAST